MHTQGTLYVVATPIGNLEDITFRAVEILKSVALVAAEDTRRTQKLLSHYQIHVPLTSYYEHNEVLKSGHILGVLQEGKDVALVSEAGTPTISDPGFRLIVKVKKAGIPIVPIPGPTAVISALAVSGLPTDSFLFLGFLPDKKGKRVKKLEEVKSLPATLVFYISKWKVGKVVADMLEVLGDRRACFCRELTKIHEEILDTTLSELASFLEGQELKGEITLVVEGKK